MDDEYEYGEEPNWRGEPEDFDVSGLDPTTQNVAQTLSKCQVRSVRLEIYAPYSHDPNSKFLAGVIYEGKDRKWRIENDARKFKDQFEAAYTLIEDLEIKRQKMLNEEFNRGFGA